MPASQPCEYVDVALYFQQLSRQRDSADGAAETVTIGDRCGRPSVSASRSDDGVVAHACDLHMRQPNLVRG
jgi:hypothetical protein